MSKNDSGGGTLLLDLRQIHTRHVTPFPYGVSLVFMSPGMQWELARLGAPTNFQAESIKYTNTPDRQLHSCRGTDSFGGYGHKAGLTPARQWENIWIIYRCYTNVNWTTFVWGTPCRQSSENSSAAGDWESEEQLTVVTTTKLPETTYRPRDARQERATASGTV